MLPDPSGSPDPVIRQAAERHTACVEEARRLDALLVLYLSNTRTPECRTVVPSLEHGDLLDSDKCGCDVCVEWDIRRRELDDALALAPKGHKWSLCACEACRFIATVHTGFLAATNRRDLLIEVAYHAQHSSRHGRHVMRWLDTIMVQLRTDNQWSAKELSRRPMAEWLRHCETAMAPIVSGRVFHLEHTGR